MTSGPDEASRLVFADLRATVGCLTGGQLVRAVSNQIPRPVLDRVGRATIARTPLPVRLRAREGGALGLHLDIRHGYRVVAEPSLMPHPGAPTLRRIRLADWWVETTFYHYHLLDQTGTELLAWHYEPDAATRGPDHPHLHVSADITARTPGGTDTVYGLDKRHLPTGIIGLTAVVRSVIEEFGAAARPDWPERLMRAEGGRPIG